MACGNNMVSRSGLQSAPVSIAMPAGPGPGVARPQPSPQRVAAVQQQARTAMDQAERRAASAVTHAVASDVVKEAQRALDAARRMRGPANERAALVRELESKLRQIEGKLASSIHDQADRIASQAREQSRVEGDRLRTVFLGVRGHLAAIGTAAEIVMTAANLGPVIGDAAQGHLPMADRFTSASQQAEEQTKRIQEQYADADVRWREQHQPGESPSLNDPHRRS